MCIAVDYSHPIIAHSSSVLIHSIYINHYHQSRQTNTRHVIEIHFVYQTHEKTIARKPYTE